MRILVSILISIIVLLFLLMYILYKRKPCENKDDLQLIQFALKQCMKDFDGICSDNNILYWADSGTLLGAIRNKGIIPHDDDIDICIFQEDFDKLLEILKTNPKYEIIHDGFIHKFKRRDIKKAKVWIDLFIVSRDNKGIIIYDNMIHRQKWPKFYYRDSETFPLKRVPFEDYYISVPSDPIPYFERGYGKDWKIPIVYDRH